MNKTTFSIMALGIILAATLLLVGAPSARMLSGSEFVDTYKETEDAIVLDVRTPGEFNDGHIASAINLDFENPTFESLVQKLDPTKTYFVYCRSGNRSEQAVAIMQKNGIPHIYELRGGIAGNTSSIKLVSNTTVPAEEYVVDSSDMLDKEISVTKTPSTTLLQKEIAGLILMREEEKMARDVYTTLGAKWNMRIFSNIAGSEQTHTDAMKVLLVRHGIADPVSPQDTVGVFQSPVLQKLYNELIVRGERSLVDALVVGATVEDLDIRDLDVLMKETTNEDILTTYRNLQKGSRNHLRAFIRNLTKEGGVYVPQYITPEMYEGIITSPQERGRA